ncbi:MAG: sugar phosphate isomerase/epimerase [Actinobacteria bacterium]|nr:sugar phosphate isomerase/epimerase [Actinomycetota bacterium]
MRIGCCGGIDQIPTLRVAGYDYVELRVVDLRPDEQEGSYAPLRREIQDGGLPAEAFNVFIPPHHPVVGPGHDLPALRAYVSVAMGRMRELGGRLVVFGSARARVTPAGFDRARAPGQILDFLRMAGEVATAHDLNVVIEPLARTACDNINTVVEGAVVARESGHARVWTLADWWHMHHNDEPLSNLAEAKERLRHVHVPVGPLPGKPAQRTDADYDAFLAALKAAGYDSRVSVEDNGKRFTDLATEAPAALAYLRARL